MITATIIREPNGDLLLEIPNIWAAKGECGRRRILANIRGRKVEVFVGLNQELWYFNTWKDAHDFDERCGQQIVAILPEDCVKWIRSHTPKNREQEQLLDYYSWLAFEYYWNLRREKAAAELVIWEQEQETNREFWYARQEAILREEAIQVFEPEGLDKKFPLEIEEDVPLDLGELNHED